MISRSNRARQTPHHLSCSDLGRAQNTGPTESLCLWGLPECLNLSGLDLGSAGSPGPATDGSQRSNLEPEQRGQGGYTCHEWGADPVWLRHCEHTPVLFVCSIPPSPKCDWTSEPKKKKKTLLLSPEYKQKSHQKEAYTNHWHNLTQQGQKLKGRRNSTWKPKKRRHQMQ